MMSKMFQATDEAEGEDRPSDLSARRED